MSMKFEWNPRKATANKAKHGVSFDEALTVFSDKLAKVFDDEGRSDDKNPKQRLLIVSFVERSDSVRIISARKATKHEQQDYEENVS